MGVFWGGDTPAHLVVGSCCVLSRVCARACHAHTHLRTRGDIASHVTLVCHLPCTPLDIPMGGTPQKGGTDTPRKHPKSPLFKGKTGVRFGHIRYPILGGFGGGHTRCIWVVCHRCDHPISDARVIIIIIMIIITTIISHYRIRGGNTPKCGYALLARYPNRPLRGGPPKVVP